MLSENFTDAIKDSYVLLDTNILLKAGLNSKPYVLLFNHLLSNNADLVILDVCKWEFIKGSASSKELREKEKVFSAFDIGIISSRILREQAEQVIKVYRRFGREVSLVDMFLAAFLVKFSHSDKVVFLTGNYRDFPWNIFNRIGIALINEKKQITPIVALQLNKDAFERSLVSF